MTALIFTDSGRVAIADLLMSKQLCLAVGSGAEAWGAAPPAIQADVGALTTPFAMLRPLQASFVFQSPTGTIDWHDGTRWAVATDPTKTIYLRYRLGFLDMPGETVRENAIFVAPKFAAGVEPGLKVVPWAQVLGAGMYLAGQRTAPRARAGSELSLDRMLAL